MRVDEILMFKKSYEIYATNMTPKKKKVTFTSKEDLVRIIGSLKEEIDKFFDLMNSVDEK
jgi:hypothetical protein